MILNSRTWKLQIVTPLRKVKYYGERSNFTLDTYYNIIPLRLKNLRQADNSHNLTEDQKVINIKSRLQEEKSIKYRITLKN